MYPPPSGTAERQRSLTSIAALPGTASNATQQCPPGVDAPSKACYTIFRTGRHCRHGSEAESWRRRGDCDPTGQPDAKRQEVDCANWAL